MQTVRTKKFKQSISQDVEAKQVPKIMGNEYDLTYILRLIIAISRKFSALRYS